MALTGHLSDLSLSELIEFFCNQRKMGLLKVRYPQGSGSFYLQDGSVVDARIGVLQGIDAVYFALTLPNAAFEFKPAAEPADRTINQPWTQVVLEGLRRLDEGINPEDAFLGYDKANDPDEYVPVEPDSGRDDSQMPAFLSLAKPSALSQRKPLIIAAAAVAVLVSVAAIGVPAGWYGRSKPAVAASKPSNGATPATQPTDSPITTAQAQPSAEDTHGTDAASLAARRQREKDKEREKAAKARDDKANAQRQATAAAQPTPSGGGKKVTVQVSYDESGRVVAANGADPTALRIARQRRFPAGKAGTATITIPIN